MLHSSAVPESELSGTKARLLEMVLAEHWSTGAGPAVLLPFFFGPSAALTEYVPARLEVLRTKYPDGKARLARPLVDLTVRDDRRVACALADAVRLKMNEAGLQRPAVVLVDHGTPQPAVTAVREFLGEQLRAELGDEVQCVGTASMERREGEAYAFNEPLLARALRSAPFDTGNVVIALQFLSPGRHAGPKGDVATICEEAKRDRPYLHTHMTEPLGAHAAIVDVLADRYREMIKPGSSAQ